MKHSSQDRVARLTEELEFVRRELAHLRQASSQTPPPGQPRLGRLMTAAPVLLLGTWLLLSAGAPASQDDLEQRVSELEARLLKGPGRTTRIQAPFEVVGPGGNVILQVSPTFPTVSNGVGIFWQGTLGGVTVSRGGHDIAGMGTSESGDGGLLFIGDQYGIPRSEVRASDGVQVLNEGGKVVAAMVAMDETPGDGRFALMRGDKMIASLSGIDDGGMLDISDDRGKSVASVWVDDGSGNVATLDQKGRPEVELGVSEKGEPRLAVSVKGKERAILGLSIAAGHLAVLNAQDQVVANVTGTGPADGGAVTVANGSGRGVANLTAGADGSGLVQVFYNGPHSGSVAVLTQDKVGGLLQIKNASGTPVANLKAGAGGAGYWQLTDPGGNPVVEAGFDGGSGIVRAGPFYKCAPAIGTAIVGVALLPDCIKGRSTP